ncbi:MAG: hypothetical protein AB7H77_11175 [Bdellovibrionales bacterium]
MTNEYGSNPRPEDGYEHEPESGNEPVMHEPGAGEQVPFDDFSDPAGHSEEGIAPEATVSHDADSEETEAAPPRLPRSKWPLFAGIGGILLLGGIIYWQFGHSSPSTPQFSPPPIARKSSPASPASASGNQPGADNGINSASKIPSVDTVQSAQLPPDTMPTAPTTGMSPTDTQQPAASAAIPPSSANAEKPALQPPPATIAEAKAPLVPEKPQTAQPNADAQPGHPFFPAGAGPVNAPPSAAVVSSSQSPGAPGSETPVQQQRVNLLSTRIDSLQKSLEEQTRQLDRIASMVAANSSSGDGGVATSSIQSRLDRLEQNIVKLQNQQAAKGIAVSSPSGAASESAMSGEDARPARPAATKKKRVAAKKKKTTTSRSSTSTASSGNESRSLGRLGPNWILRAATPREAWVSTDSTSAELRHVQVGDSLAGVGTVRAIRKSGGGWVIEGTQGSIR